MTRRTHATPDHGAKAEQLLHDLIAGGQLSLGPVSFERLEQPKPDADGLLRAMLPECELERQFAFEYKTSWTRKSRAEAVERLRQRHEAPLLPLLIAPYLSERILDELAELKISAIDLCGNGLLVDPPSLFILRTGAKKRGLLPAPAQLAVYNSSNVSTLVPRVFFSQRLFPTTTAALEACHARRMPVKATDPPLTLATVSKALRRLDEDLITEHRGRQRSLADPVRLLDHLQAGMRLPSSAPISMKTRLGADEIRARLRALRPGTRYVVTGRGSAARYAGLAGPGRLQLYVSDLAAVRRALEAKSTQAFPNLELTQTSEEAPYFDAQEFEGVTWSSPLQCYLELARANSDPREREVAKQVRAALLKSLDSGPKQAVVQV